MWGNFGQVQQGMPEAKGKGKGKGKAEMMAAFGFGAPKGGAPMGGGGSTADQIKEMQKTDPAAKEQWIAFCNQFGEGKRDPNLHDSAFHQQFVTQYNSGTRMATEADGEDIGSTIKLMQKRSTPFKNMWSQYCSQAGGGKNDPSKHDSGFHVAFLDHLAQQASGASGGGGGGDPMMQMMQMMQGGGPQKRQRTDIGMGGSGDPMKDALVNSVKTFQKTGEEQKQAWWSHCDSMLGGVRDPNRHDNATLQMFLDMYGVPVSTGGGGVPAGFAFGGGGGGGGGGDSSLVARIKAYQKTGEAEKAAWAVFCKGKKDPSRHDEATLSEFVATHAVP